MIQLIAILCLNPSGVCLNDHKEYLSCIQKMQKCVEAKRHPSVEAPYVYAGRRLPVNPATLSKEDYLDTLVLDCAKAYK